MEKKSEEKTITNDNINQHDEIIELILVIPESERNYNTDCSLTSTDKSYNKYNKALGLLKD